MARQASSKDNTCQALTFAGFGGLKRFYLVTIMQFHKHCPHKTASFENLHCTAWGRFKRYNMRVSTDEALNDGQH